MGQVDHISPKGRQIIAAYDKTLAELAEVAAKTKPKDLPKPSKS